MTARWRSGAEIAPHTTETEFSGGTAGAPPTNASQDSAIKRSGSYSLKFTGAGYTGSILGFNMPGAAVRTYIYLVGSPSTASPFLGVWSPTNATLASLQLRMDRKLELYLGYAGTLLATSTFTIPTGSFDNCIELWVDHVNNVVATRYNGTEWARATAAFTETVDAAWFGPPGGLGTTIHFDDMAINSLDGPYNNGWPGPSAGGVLTFRPSATADSLSWFPIGAPTYHECLDDVVPDGFTTQIQENAGVNGAVAGVYFPAWPVSVPASAVMIGLVGATAAATSTMRVTFRDPMDRATDANITLMSAAGWNRHYPLITAERAWDGTRRPLSNGYLAPAAGGRSRVIIVRTDSLAGQWQVVTSLWMTVDFPLALAAAPVPVGVHDATILAALNL